MSSPHSSEQVGASLAQLHSALVARWNTDGPAAVYDSLHDLTHAQLRALVMAHTGAAVQ